LLIDRAAPPVRELSQPRVADLNMMRLVPVLIVTVLACNPNSGTGVPGTPDSGSPGTDAGSADPDASTGCAAGTAGAACVIDLHDAATSCDPAAIAKLRAELDARKGLGPLWAGGRALFRTPMPMQIAGTFNSWSATALASQAFCSTDLALTVAPVPSGFHQYKLVSGSTWSLDSENPAFAYDAFEGNLDSKNSVLNTHDSGRGHIVKLDRVCSTALGNCRDVTAYFPPGYDAPAAASRTYPVLFMHDGQNVWDDTECCYGHGGWEVNLTLDREIAAGRVAPVIVVAADATTNRSAEYAFASQAAFMAFQVNEIQPRALAKVRGNDKRLIGGSSFGGLVSLELAFRYPQTYVGVASFSGAVWPGVSSGTGLRDRLPTIGKRPIAIYLDWGGDPETNADNATYNVEIRDLMIDLGWQSSCAFGPDALCEHWEPDALHTEAAWRARVWRAMRFLFPP
jgi:predicted alpha/beta superfamily hydrolase